MGEERDEIIRVGFDLPLETGKEIVPDLYPAARRIGGRLVNDHADAAEVDVTIVGNELHRGRREIDREILLDDCLVAAKKFPERCVARNDAQHGRAFLDARKLGWQRNAQFLFTDGLRVLLRRERLFRTSGRECRRDGFQSCALVGNVDLDRREPDHVGLRQRDLRRVPLEAWRQQVRTHREGYDDDYYYESNQGESSGGSASFKSAHVEKSNEKQLKGY